MRRASVVAALVVGFLGGVAVHPAQAASITLFGGNGGHGDGTSQNDGWLVAIEPSNATVTPIGHPIASVA